MTDRPRKTAPLRRQRHPGSLLIEEAMLDLLLGGSRVHPALRPTHAPVRPARGVVPGAAEREAWARFHAAMAAGG